MACASLLLLEIKLVWSRGSRRREPHPDRAQEEVESDVRIADFRAIPATIDIAAEIGNVERAASVEPAIADRIAELETVSSRPSEPVGS